jgi:hypothetical protein
VFLTADTRIDINGSTCCMGREPGARALKETWMLRYLIGIGLPFLGVIGALPWVAAQQDRYVFGVPFIYAWIFAWFLVTSGCLFVCWHFFDRHRYADES